MLDRAHYCKDFDFGFVKPGDPAMEFCLCTKDDIYEPITVKAATKCPKCGLEAKTLLHQFCTHAPCPVRDALNR